ncbi:hypothetical protein PENSUB_11455 [Penicillium subrubescens]|uniref:Uncharacterized protein n=1 Tax=Penicillium subrubescens TaxID=1316194 RepID=A0A1Q5UQE1_9EURO|nr:hypothetical protein PENSUB_11455 [Penicillium subrubescens]
MAEDTPINPTPAMMNPVADKKKKKKKKKKKRRGKKKKKKRGKRLAECMQALVQAEQGMMATQPVPESEGSAVQTICLPVEGASRSDMTAVRSEEEAAEQHSESVPTLATLERENQQTPSLEEHDTSQSPAEGVGQQRKQAPARRYPLRPEAPVFIPSASRLSGFPGSYSSALNPAAASYVPSSRLSTAAPRPDNPRVAGIRGVANSSPPAQHSRASPNGSSKRYRDIRSLNKED